MKFLIANGIQENLNLLRVLMPAKIQQGPGNLKFIRRCLAEASPMGPRLADVLGPTEGSVSSFIHPKTDAAHAPKARVIRNL
jgi:hypothetical protein